MSVDEAYAMCPTCKVTYRPGVQDSRHAHFVALGHWPPDEPLKRPPTPPTGELTVTPGDLIRTAARRIADLEAVIAGLDALADTWDRATDPELAPGRQDAADMLRGYLKRPPVHALEEEARDGG
jgi:hypothetical protein